MLQKLSIQNYALIDTLTIEFDGRLNIITGETGAGKSIILGALSLILGQRIESKYFFNQAKKCIIEGVFVLKDESLKTLFEANDLDFFEETILRREIAIDGKSRAFINDSPTNLSILKQIGEQLIAIHSQHATQEINDADFQLLIVDALANHQPLLTQYRTDFKQLKQDQLRLKEMIAIANEAKSKQDYEQYLFNELEQAALKPGEQEILELELEKLTHAEGIKRNLLATTALLSENEIAAIALLKEASTQLQVIEKFDPAIQSLYERLKSAIIEIRDIADETSSVEQNTLHSAEQLISIQQRLDLLYTLQQKHRVSNNDELIALQQKLEENLNNLITSDENIEKLEANIKSRKEELNKIATKLSENRKKSIVIVEKETQQILHQLEMPSAKLKFVQETSIELNKDGQDQIALLFSANAGQVPAPIGKVASGGELSRLMLSVKTLLAKFTSLPTLVFDEIDTGISGETALKVGEVLENLGHDMQIISITHLPQIAAKGNAHFFVFKNETNDKTTTDIRKLADNERIGIIAEMLTGKNPGASAIQNARELIGQFSN